MTDRGQTANDYLIGVGILLVSVTTVFTFFPTVYQPFEDPVSADERTISDRVAEDLIEKHRTTFDERTLDYGALEAQISQDNLTDTDQALSGIPELKTVNINVRVQKRPGGKVLVEGGAGFDDQDPPQAAVTNRVFAAASSGECTNSCRLVVRVWSL